MHCSPKITIFFKWVQNLGGAWYCRKLTLAKQLSLARCQENVISSSIQWQFQAVAQAGGETSVQERARVVHNVPVGIRTPSVTAYLVVSSKPNQNTLPCSRVTHTSHSTHNVTEVSGTTITGMASRNNDSAVGVRRARMNTQRKGIQFDHGYLGGLTYPHLATLRNPKQAVLGGAHDAPPAHAWRPLIPKDLRPQNTVTVLPKPKRRRTWYGFSCDD